MKKGNFKEAKTALRLLLILFLFLGALHGAAKLSANTLAQDIANRCMVEGGLYTKFSDSGERVRFRLLDIDYHIVRIAYRTEKLVIHKAIVEVIVYLPGSRIPLVTGRGEAELLTVPNSAQRSLQV